MGNFIIEVHVIGSVYTYYADNYPSAAILMSLLSQAVEHAKLKEAKSGKILSEF